VNGDRVPDESEARKPNGNLPEIAQTSSEKEKDADMLVGIFSLGFEAIIVNSR